MSSSFSLLLSARVAVATYFFSNGPFQLMRDAVSLARDGGVVRAGEGLDMATPLLQSSAGVVHPYRTLLATVRTEYEHAYRTHVPVCGAFFALAGRGGWVQIRSMERGGAHGSITVSSRNAREIFGLLRRPPGSYQLRREQQFVSGSHFVRVDDPTASHFGQLYLEVGHPSRSGMYFGNPATEHLNLSALLALESRVAVLTRRVLAPAVPGGLSARA
ncbi:hypothetical protein [Burkholderia ubonensis]|uniref:Uncharacterized protein n=1 Tax=Burkholderia ubonensis subsp. mesacidophila TaxID=265293 RepID=A0A2A4FCI7_9BURK|nr:hypothetical protein [Burkholderia ubonensis]PCE30049.1 hypothetical protein BZL54_23070 [Burkholderia ubonensis subsp. mesacidophila]